MKRYSDNFSPGRWKRICSPAQDSDSDSSSDSDNPIDIYRRLFGYGGPNCTRCDFPNLVCSCSLQQKLATSSRQSMILLDPVDSIESVESPAGGNGPSHASASSSNGNSSSSSSSYQPSLSSGTTTAGHSDTSNERSSVSFRASTSIQQFRVHSAPRSTVDYENRQELGLFSDEDDTINLFQAPKLHDFSHGNRPRESSESSIEVMVSGATVVAATSSAGTVAATTSSPATVFAITSSAATVVASTSSAEREINKELDEFNARLLSLIECPVCLEPISPPIHQCRRGHLVCGKCKSQLNQCPTCRDRMSEMRNFAVERMAELLKYPCRNAGLGCPVAVLLSGKNAHKLACAGVPRGMANVFTNKMTKTGHVTSDPGATQKVKKSTSLGVPTNNNKGFNTLSQGQYSQTRQMQTMGMKTRQSLIQLLQKLVHGSPHFIRCLRRCKTASGTVVLDKTYLADQIRACNLVETIRIRQNGYAYRIPFVEFLRRYQFLAFDYDETVDMTQDNCRLLLLRLKMPQEGWMMGKTKVFLKYHTEEYLSRLYESQVRKIVKVQAIMRAVMVKLKKKQGGSSRPAQRRQPIRTANDMSKDEAALAIQKSYRGYSVRKEYGCAPGKPKRFQCVTIQEEAANTIQYFWRKWKGKSIYQQLLLYRAAKQQDLTYFCQQVHIYNQESCGNVRKTEAPVNLREISIRPRLANRSIPKPTGPKKLPLLLKNRHFLDTTFMCVKAFNKSDLVVRQKPTSLDLPNAAPMNKNNRTPSPPSSQSASRYGRYDDKSPATRNRTPSPKQSPSNPVTERSISPNTNGASPNKINIQVTEWNRKSPEPPKYGLSKPVGPKVNAQPTYTGYSMAKPSDQRQIAKEIERKAVELGKTSNEEDAAPFNFQVLDTSFNNYSVILTHFVWHKGMLKKTNYSRGSLKRQNGEKADSENNFGNRATSPSVVYQSKPGYSPTNIKISHQAPSPTLKHQIIPGLVIEGEEADL